MNSNFLTAMTAAGIIALGANDIYAEKTVAVPETDGNAGARRHDEAKRPELRENREFERERVIEFVLKEKYPRELEAINKIRKDDPEKARQQMSALKNKIWEEQKAEREKLREMVEAYRHGQDPRQLEAIRAKIAQKLEERLAMEKKLIAHGETRLKEMQERLAKFKADHQKRLDNKTKMIENKIKELSKSPELFF